MKRDHLVPVAVKDIGDIVSSKIVKQSDRLYHIQRLEEIRDYCNTVINWVIYLSTVFSLCQFINNIRHTLGS